MNDNRKHSENLPPDQGAEAPVPGPLRIGASTPYDFSARNLTAYGGLLPVATMLERLGFQQLVEEMLSIHRLTRAMPVYRFVLAMVLALYVGFARLNHLRFLEREPMLMGIIAHPGANFTMLNRPTCLLTTDRGLGSDNLADPSLGRSACP